MVKLLAFLRAALAGLRQSPRIHAVAAATVASALLLGALAIFGLTAVQRALDAWSAEVEVTLYLRPGTSELAGEALAAQIRQIHRAEARRVSGEQALMRLKAELGPAGEVLGQLPHNPLPDTIEVRPRASDRGAAKLASLVALWSAEPEVESVEYGRDFVERLERLAVAARGAGLALLVVVLLVAAGVVAATLELAIHGRREEIEIQKLVGATDAFVYAPFLVEGMVQGLAGAALAGGVLGALLRVFGAPLAEAARALAGEALFPRALSWEVWAALSGAGLLLGLCGSLLAVRRVTRI